MTAAKEVKTTAAVFELPQRLGILQYVEYESPRGGVPATAVSSRVC
jgi:hypothetical protein